MVGPEGRVVRRGARRRYLTSHEASRPSLKSIHGDRRSTWGLCCGKSVPLSWPRAKVSQRRPFVRFRAQPRSPLVEFRRPSVAGCQPAGACVASGVNLQNLLCKRFHGEGRGSRPQMRQRFGGARKWLTDIAPATGSSGCSRIEFRGGSPPSL